MTGRGREGEPLLFREFPARSHERLVQHDGGDASKFLCWQFAHAAERLAATFQGEPIDDAILLPWLYLYRHAFELSLKESIRYAAAIRRKRGDSDVTLDSDEVEDRLQRRHSHSLGKLIHEVGVHLEALSLKPLPKEVTRMASYLAQADPNGEAFRYPGILRSTGSSRIDFHDLNAAMTVAYGLLSVTPDVLQPVDEYMDFLRDY